MRVCFCAQFLQCIYSTRPDLCVSFNTHKTTTTKLHNSYFFVKQNFLLSPQLKMKLILTILAALLLARAECLVQNLTIPNVASEIKITWENQGEKTFFNVRAKLVDVDITNCWIGVGLNDRIEMVSFSFLFGFIF